MSVTIAEKKQYDSLAWICAFVLHVILLLFFFFYHLHMVKEKPEEEFAGVSVVFGDEEAGLDDATVGSEELISANESASAANVEKQNNEIIASEKEEVVIKKTNEVKKAPIKPNTTPNNTTSKSTTSGTGTATKPSDEELTKKKSQFGSLFGKGSGTGGEAGNQGSTKGEPNGQVLSGISKGTGRVGGGLSNRNIVQAPTVSESSQKYGKVVIKVCVDKTGKVIEASFTQKGSNTTDSHLVAISEKAARKYVFAPGELEQQCGTITFDYKLN